MTTLDRYDNRVFVNNLFEMVSPRVRHWDFNRTSLIPTYRYEQEMGKHVG